MDFLQLYRAMVTAREIDRLEAELVQRGEASFHVSGAGHESSALLAGLLTRNDWLHCHYRDKALMLARGMKPQAFFDALYCTDASHSRGRQMSAHMCDAQLRILSMVGPVGNNALQAVGVAAQIRDQLGDPIVTCLAGDGTTQQGEFLEACAEAVRDQLPVLFVVEDNRWAISTDTSGKTFYSLPDGIPAHLFGMPIDHADGRDPALLGPELGAVVSAVRRERKPAVLVLHVERLHNHTNADDQSIYRSKADIHQGAVLGDPLDHLERHLVAAGCSVSALQGIREEVAREVAAAAEVAAQNPDPVALHTAKAHLPQWLTNPASERRGANGGLRLTMKDALREVLKNHLEQDPRVTLYGEDIEDPKGDVFGVTKGLSTQFGERVRNSPLAEATVIGTSIGRALAGGRPVAFLQFADFLPLAYNQIVSELGSMHWRTDGQWQAPVIVMAACGGYRPGLGPFHAQTFDAVAVHTPGVDVFMPATAEDAAGMLNAAFKSERPTLFLYPKSALNDPANTTGADVEQQFVPIGTARVVRAGRNLTLVGWGNTVRMCEQVADTLETVGIDVEVVDLRSLSPWDQQTVIASAEKTAHLVVVHEDNHTCGLGAEVLATVAEHARVPVVMRRVTRADTFIPCNFPNQMEVLPTYERILTVAAELLDLDINWTPQQDTEEGFAYIEAVGSGPADETVVVTELFVKPGDSIKRGDTVAALEATKSVFDLTAGASGTVEQILVREGETVAVGDPLLKLATGVSHSPRMRIAYKGPGTPTLVPRRRSSLTVTSGTAKPRSRQVGLAGVAAVCGGERVSNERLTAAAQKWSAEQVLDRTGIANRQWIKAGESAVSMAVKACQNLLNERKLNLSDVDLLICCTTTPPAVTPSTACQVLSGLSTDSHPPLVQAYDINAACSGYLYAIQSGYDYLQSRPDARVMVVTAEALSPLLDHNDQDTVYIFGDASSASLLVGEALLEEAVARVHHPDLSAKGDRKQSLCVPFVGDGFIRMNGRKVFSEAVRSMLSSLNLACRSQALSVGDLDVIVPHQANDRITEAIRRRLGIDIEVFSNIRNYGNTSSTSIPLCLAELLPRLPAGRRLGLCAFGGGFTFGAAILETLKCGSQLAGRPQPVVRKAS